MYDYIYTIICNITNAEAFVYIIYIFYNVRRSMSNSFYTAFWGSLAAIVVFYTVTYLIDIVRDAIYDKQVERFWEEVEYRKDID